MLIHYLLIQADGGGDLVLLLEGRGEGRGQGGGRGRALGTLLFHAVVDHPGHLR